MTNASAISRLINSKVGQHKARVFDIGIKSVGTDAVIVEVYNSSDAEVVGELLRDKGHLVTHWTDTPRIMEIRTNPRPEPLGSCDQCHFHSPGIGNRCAVFIYGEQCQGHIRPCCCGGTPDPNFRNEPAPRRPPNTSATGGAK